MRIDIITIFPSYFDALKLSLIGRATKRGLLEVFVHDLRDATHDRHRTVDDTPMGGGPGMVMRPEPWGELLDTLLAGDRANENGQLPGSGSDPLIIFPSPAGQVFTQKLAREFSAETQLIFGCGRYEGPDQRIFDEYSERGRVRLVSLGDYVLNGGEVATLAMLEAICRLIPGVIGNPESLLEESHENGLLEYPSYTKPAVWRGREVPSVLRSGNHAAITAWRRAQSLERTRRLRPELLGGTGVAGDAEGNSA